MQFFPIFQDYFINVIHIFRTMEFSSFLTENVRLVTQCQNSVMADTVATAICQYHYTSTVLTLKTLCHKNNYYTSEELRQREVYQLQKVTQCSQQVQGLRIAQVTDSETLAFNHFRLMPSCKTTAQHRSYLRETMYPKGDSLHCLDS